MKARNADPLPEPATRDHDVRQAPLLGRALRGVALGFAGLGVGRLLAILLQILVSRWYGHAAFGLFFTGLTYCLVIEPLITMGLQKGAMRQVAIAREKGQANSVRRIAGIALALPLLSGLVIATGGWLLAPWVGASLLGDPGLIPVLRMFSVAAVFLSLMRVAADMSRGFGTVKYAVAIEECLHPLLHLLLFLALATATPSAMAAVHGYLLATLAAGILMAALLARQCAAQAPDQSSDGNRHVVRDLLLYSLPMMPFGILHMTSTFMDVGMLNYFRDAAEVGEYGAAARWTLLAALVANPLLLMFGPLLAAKHGVADTAAIRALFSAMSRWLLYLLVPVVAVLCMAAEPLVALFGPGYDSSAPLALITLALGTLIASFSGCAAILMIVSGHQKTELFCLLAALLANFLLNALLIPPLGILGAAIATASAGTLAAVLRFLVVWRSLGIQPFNREFAMAGGASVLSLACCLALAASRPDGTAAALATAALAGAIAVALCAAAFFTSNDRCALKSAMLEKAVGKAGPNNPPKAPSP